VSTLLPDRAHKVLIIWCFVDTIVRHMMYSWVSRSLSKCTAVARMEKDSKDSRVMVSCV